ncbi:MAG: preprotein translocase subunit SecE [Verrucomicrobia bacterium]|nr:preprotein translocase subunit SecE [Verrucomicrobiota bacterium]
MNLTQKTAGTARVPSHPIKRAYEYFEEIKTEFSKIQWTEGGEVLTLAKVVVAATFLFGLSIYVADVVIHRVLMSLDAIFKWVVG